jgi:cytochrome c553
MRLVRLTLLIFMLLLAPLQSWGAASMALEHDAPVTLAVHDADHPCPGHDDSPADAPSGHCTSCVTCHTVAAPLLDSAGLFPPGTHGRYLHSAEPLPPSHIPDQPQQPPRG